MELTSYLKYTTKTSKNKKLLAQIKKHKFYYLLMLPGLLFFVIFRYIPMAGIIVAFKDVAPFDGIKEIISAPFVGFKHFQAFFKSIFFWSIFKNTIIISIYNLIFGFSSAIIFALLLNELKNVIFKKVVQSLSYLPYFLSMVVVAGIVMNVTTTDGGIINEILKAFGNEPIMFLGSEKYFRGVLVLTQIWQELGWGAIVYMAAISGISEELYEAAIVDGANRWKRVIHVTIPGILPIIVIMFILQCGRLLDAGFDRVLMLYNPSVYGVADIIDTYVYRVGIAEMKYSFATAVGLFKSLIALVLICFVNWGSKKLGQEGLW